MYYHDVVKKKRDENPFLRNTELAYDMLLESIIDGELKPGEKILQDSFAKKLDMSRTPVRDALLHLERDGFIVNCEKGFLVKAARYSDYAELCEFRCGLETFAASLAVRNIEEAQLDLMANNIAEMRQLAKDKNRPNAEGELTRLDFAFHRFIIDATENHYLTEAYSTCLPKLYFYQQMVRKKAYNISYTIETHKQILEALSRRDSVALEGQIREHCGFYRRRAVQRFFEER